MNPFERILLQKKLFTVNLENFPYVRGIHFKKDISLLKRIDKSYSVIEGFDLGHFRVDHPEINRTLIGLPYKSLDDQPLKSKTEYHDLLYRQEDERYK